MSLEDHFSVCEKLELLLRNGADPNEFSDTPPKKPLIILSALERNWDCVALLLRAKANPLVPTEDGRTYLLDLVADPSLQATVLDFVSDVNQKLVSGESILHRTLRLRVGRGGGAPLVTWDRTDQHPTNSPQFL